MNASFFCASEDAIRTKGQKFGKLGNEVRGRFARRKSGRGEGEISARVNGKIGRRKWRCRFMRQKLSEGDFLCAEGMRGAGRKSA